MNSLLKMTLGGALIATFSAQISQATPVTATLTVDNHYGLFVGDADATNMSYIGRDSGNWQDTDTHNFDADAGQRLFLYAWDFGGVQAFIGKFAGWNGTLFTNDTDWEWALLGTSQDDPGENGVAPSEATFESTLAGASWNSIGVTANNDIYSLWANRDIVRNIGSSAKFIWGDGFNSTSNVIAFRSTQLEGVLTDPTNVPEPGTLALLGLGLIGVARLRFKSTKA